jgi:hypothetical protein
MLILTLESNPMLNTAGLLRWAMNGYKFKRDRKNLRRVFVESFRHPRLTDEVVDKLLSGELPHKIAGDKVVIELPD